VDVKQNRSLVDFPDNMKRKGNARPFGIHTDGRKGTKGMQRNQQAAISRPPRVVIDACVWHAAFLRDLLVHAAVVGVIAPIWTPTIEHEWTKSVRVRRPDIDPARLESITSRIRVVIPNGCIPMPTLRIVPGTLLSHLPDPDDWHVVAAALASRSSTICTFDKKGFPNSALATVGLESVTPDRLLERLLVSPNPTSSPRLLLQAMQQHRTSLRAPTIDAHTYVAMLKRNTLAKTARALEGQLGVI